MTGETVYIIDKLELSCATVALREDGLFQIDMKEVERELNLKDLRELTESIGIIGKGAKYPVLLRIKLSNTITKEASEFSASEIGGRYTLANAIIVNSKAVSTGVNLFFKLYKPVRPTKMFTSEEKAIVWLKKIISR